MMVLNQTAIHEMGQINKTLMQAIRDNTTKLDLTMGILDPKIPIRGSVLIKN